MTNDDGDARAGLLFGMVLAINIAARGGVLLAAVERLASAILPQLDAWR